MKNKGKIKVLTLNGKSTSLIALFKRDQAWLIPLGVLFCANLWPVLNFYNENIIEWPTISFKGNVEIITFTLTSFIIPSAASIFFTRRNVDYRIRIFIILSLLTIFSFYIIPVLTWLQNLSQETTVLQKLNIGVGLVSYVLMALFSIVFWFFSANKEFRKITSLIIVSITSVALLQLFYSLIANDGGQVAQGNNQPEAGQTLSKDNYIASLKPVSTPENVYYIILDAYSSTSTLKELGFDNSPFITKMKSFGFSELEEGYTNYTKTHLLLKGVLGMNYPVEGEYTQYSYDNVYPIGINAGSDPLAYRALRKMGYSIKRYANHYHSCQNSLNCYDHNQTSGFNPDTALVAYLRTNIVLRIYYKFMKAPHPEPALLLFQKHLENNPIKPSSFVFIHNFEPHPPSRFNENCQPKPEENSRSKYSWSIGDEAFYFKAISCTNKMTTNLIEKIQTIDPTAIIIIQSDHGSDFYTDHDIDIAEWTKKSMKERGSFLNLILAPNECKKWLYPKISQINTMRFAVACLQRKKPQYLKDKSFIVGKSEVANFGTVFEYDFSKDK